MTNRITVTQATAPTDAVRNLIGELDAILSAEYPPEQRHGLALDAIFAPHVSFFLAELDGAPVGCGGVALFGDFAEVKRMYVRDAARGQGVAQAVLARLEAEARAAGLARLCLETGTVQHAAMRLYERAGFKTCGPFGDYRAMPPEALTTSVFYEKSLAS
jgi:putative acetyltransferase